MNLNHAPVPSLVLSLLLAAVLPGQDGSAEDERLAELRRWTDEVAPQVEALRGLEFVAPVEVQIATADDFRSYAQKQLAKMGTAEERAALETAAKLLGLFPVDGDFWEATIELLTGQVGGYYDPDTKSFWMMEGVEGALAKSTLSHELVHALEDQHYGLGERLEALSGDSDRAAAFHAVAEGTASLVANRWLLDHYDQFDLQELMSLMESNQLDAMFAAEPVLWLPTVFSYLGGQTFLHESKSLIAAQVQPFEIDRLDRAFREPPVSTEQVLHPDKYWEATARDLPHALAIGPVEGWTVLEDDTLGEVVLSLVARGERFVAPEAGDQEALFRIRFTTPASEGWGGDRWQLLARGDARALVLATSWDTAADRDEWRAALDEGVESLRRSAESLANGGPSSVSISNRGADRCLLVVVVGAEGSDGTSAARELLDALELSVELPPRPPAAEPEAKE